MASNLVFIDDSRFIFETNFAGDPRKDRFGSQQRKGNIIIPDADLAKQLIDEGYNVRMTKPREGEEEDFTPTYFIAIKLNYGSKWPPKVYLINDEGRDILLDEDSIGMIDDLWIDRVNVVLNRYESDRGKSLYVKSMEVYQRIEDDPISMRHRHGRTMPDVDERVIHSTGEDDAFSFNGEAPF